MAEAVLEREGTGQVLEGAQNGRKAVTQKFEHTGILSL